MERTYPEVMLLAIIGELFVETKILQERIEMLGGWNGTNSVPDESDNEGAAGQSSTVSATD
jgi:hypothetical protein